MGIAGRGKGWRAWVVRQWVGSGAWLQLPLSSPDGVHTALLLSALSGVSAECGCEVLTSEWLSKCGEALCCTLHSATYCRHRRFGTAVSSSLCVHVCVFWGVLGLSWTCDKVCRLRACL